MPLIAVIPPRLDVMRLNRPHNRASGLACALGSFIGRHVSISYV
nr:hypothetical protein [Ochrobactrum sp. CM-21-5]